MSSPLPSACAEIQQRCEKATPLIWWVSQEDVERIDAGASADSPGTWHQWPPYLMAEFASKRGRYGRARLWVADEIKERFGEIDVSAAWIDMKPACAMAEICGGIVIAPEDYPRVAHLPGFVTDLSMNLLAAITALTERNAELEAENKRLVAQERLARVVEGELPPDPWQAFAVLVSACANGLAKELGDKGWTTLATRNAIIRTFLDMASGEACRIAREEGRDPDQTKWRAATDDAFSRAVERTHRKLQAPGGG